MAYVHPAWEEHQRKRFTRPDGDRYLKPGPERWLSPEELRLLHPELYERKFGGKPPFDRRAWFLRTRGAVQDTTALQTRNSVDHPLDDPEVRRLLAEIKLDLLRWQYWRKAYNPNQPRVPAGNPDGGQWTSEGGGAAVTVMTSPAESPGLIASDASPDGIRAWAQYAEADGKQRRDAAAVERTTANLHKVLMQVSTTVARRPGSSPREYGTDVHTAFARAVRTLNLPGIERIGVEQSYDAEGEARYGKDGSIRTDVTLRNEEREIIAIYDLKTGEAIIRPSRAAQLRAKTRVGPEVPIIEMHSVRGTIRR